MFREALEGGHGAVVRNCLSILRNRFAGEYEVEGYRKDGPVAVALFVVRARGLRADRRDKLLKWLDTEGQDCTPNNMQAARRGELVTVGDVDGLMADLNADD